MEYISSDTNIWIDFLRIHKLDLPFRLPYTYLMNADAVADELLSPEGLRERLLQLGLQPVELTEEEFYFALDAIAKYKKLSKYDATALAIAKMRGLVLLTGDMALRKAAFREGVLVRGTIGLLDELFAECKINKKEYEECIRALLACNGKEVRLPEEELKKRLSRHNKNVQKEDDWHGRNTS